MSFGSSAPGSIGVEEELFLVDAESLRTVPIGPALVAGSGPRLKTELFACIAETTTPICSDVAGVLEELTRLRREVADRAAARGATILAAGTHPTARGEHEPLSPDPVYVEVAAQLGPAVSRQLVCGLHVHVGLPDEQTCLRALEGVLPWLPLLLSLSANSPFVDGADSGLRSARAERLAELPSGGAPPVFRTWSDWETRPHPLYGTLEVRIPDQQTDVRRSAAFAGLVQALVRRCAEQDPGPYDRELYAERRRLAAAERPETEELQAFVEPAARELGSWAVVRELLEAPGEAERQLETGLASVERELAARSLA